MDDYQSLNLGDATSIVTGIAVQEWGAHVRISCIYDPLGVAQPYHLLFQDCRALGWHVLEDANLIDGTADLYGLELGCANHQRAAIISTDLFEVSIVYGSMKIHKDRVAEAG